MKKSTLISILFVVGVIGLFIISPQLRSLLGLTSSETVRIQSTGSAESTESTAPVEQDYELITLLPKDRIRSIDNPEFVTGAEADAQYSPDELVLGVEIDGDARAYSIPFLSGHEIVNDIVAGKPIAVTW